jgi:hypothetical protein
MSALAKVFVVFVCVLSVAFFGTSATLLKTRTDWRAAYQKLETATGEQLAELAKRNGEVFALYQKEQDTNKRMKAEHDQTGKELAQSVQDLTEEKKLRAAAQGEVAKANSLTQQSLTKLESMDKLLAQLNEAHDKLKGQYDDALKTTREAQSQRDSMRLDLEKSQGELHNLRVEYAQLDQVKESNDVLLERCRQLLGPGFPTGPGAPTIDALVKAVDGKEKLILISAGRDQKVELGHEFTVYRGNQFIGKVKVIKVFPDLAGAQVLFTKDGEEIQQGDRASTNI